MKKLMIAAAIVCAAAFAQAASFTWATDPVGSISAADLANGLKAGTKYTADPDNHLDITYWAVNYSLALTYGGETETLKGTLLTDGLSGGIYDDSLASKLVASERYVDWELTLTATIQDDKGASWDITANPMSGTWYTGVGDLTFGNGVPSTWSTAAVPEPTSGLLLLLGVAGLALRRRHA